jgi:hypothetical protein
MEKQAQEGQAARAPMASMQPLSATNNQWPILIGVLAALGLAAYVAVKVLTPAAPVSSVTAVPAVASVNATQPVAVGNINDNAALVQTNAEAVMPPYIETAPATIAMPFGPPVDAQVSSAPAQSLSAASVQLPSNDKPMSSVALADTAATPDTMALTSPADAPVAPVVAVTPEPIRAAPAPRVQPDKTFFDSTNFKLGRQADSAKDQDVSHWVNLFSSEMAAGNHEQARTYLAKIQSKLPAQSITLLRMQAWYAVDTGDDGIARSLFLSILDRVPDDQNAGVNSALIDWRAGRLDAALARMDSLHQKFPDSPLVSQNWRAMHDQRQ